MEAVIDFRITPVLGLPELEAICAEIQETYPRRENIYHLAGEFTFDAKTQSASTAGSQRHIGYKVSSRDERQVAQLRTDGFAYSVRAPYGNWDGFASEARRLWEIYAPRHVNHVVRCAVRYINRLELPMPANNGGEFIDLSHYLQTAPMVSHAYSQQNTTGFFLQIQIPQPDLEAMLILNIAPAPPNFPAAPATNAPANVAVPTSLIVDIDLFSERSQNPWPADEAESLWNYLNMLRVRKNEIFEGTITDETRRLIA